MEPKEEIRKKAFEIGADDIGFASIDDYKSPRSADPKKIMPGVKSIVVLAYRQTDGGLDTDNMRVAMAARIGIMDYSKGQSYEMCRFIENRFRVKAAPILFSYPLNLENPRGRSNRRCFPAACRGRRRSRNIRHAQPRRAPEFRKPRRLHRQSSLNLP